MSGFLGRMRGTTPQAAQQQQQQQQQPQPGMLGAQYTQAQQQQLYQQQQQHQQQMQMQQQMQHLHHHHQQQQQQQQMGRPRTTPTTPQFPSQYGHNGSAHAQGAMSGIHDCMQPHGGKPLYLCQPFVKAALVKGSFKTITAVPKYVDGMEWVAVNLVDFFHNINLFLGIISEHCTRENCPTMSAGPGMDYTWTSGPTKKQVKVPAPEYTDYVLTWAEKLIGDETMFPTKSGREFSPAFPKTAVHLYTQFLRIFAHLYHAHFRDILHLSLEAHLNSLFAHFLMFGLTFELLDPKECRAPREGWGFVVGDLMDAWRAMGILEG